MPEFIDSFAAALGESAGGFPGDGVLVDRLLALAKLVADGTGDRVNAPLSTYLAGSYVARTTSERTPLAAVDEAIAIARRLLESSG